MTTQACGATSSSVQAAMNVNEIVLGLSKLHKDNVVCADLKPGNVLMDRSGGLVISDFRTQALWPTERISVLENENLELRAKISQARQRMDVLTKKNVELELPRAPTRAWSCCGRPPGGEPDHTPFTARTLKLGLDDADRQVLHNNGIFAPEDLDVMASEDFHKIGIHIEEKRHALELRQVLRSVRLSKRDIDAIFKKAQSSACCCIFMSCSLYGLTKLLACLLQCCTLPLCG
jgi:hypothetical protein